MDKLSPPELAEELLRETQGAQLYEGGPGVHYGRPTKSGRLMNPHAVSIALLYGGFEFDETRGLALPTKDTEVFFAKRKSGDGPRELYGLITGYADEPTDDPLRAVFEKELDEETRIPKDVSAGFEARLGKRFTEPRPNGTTLHVHPIAVALRHRPNIIPNEEEIGDPRWIELGAIATARVRLGFEFTPGCLENTIPRMLAAFEEPPQEARVVEPSSKPDMWQAMGPDRRRRAIAVREAIAAGPLREYGVTLESLYVVRPEPNRFFLVQAGPGIDLGSPGVFDPSRSYDSIMSPQNDRLFQVSTGEMGYGMHSLRGMTDAIYLAKVQAEFGQVHDATLRPGRELGRQIPDEWWAMLVREPLWQADGNVQLRRVTEGGQVDMAVTAPGNGAPSLRFCPAVEII